MTVRETISEGAGNLAPHETETPRLDAALMLGRAMGLSREKLYMNLAEPVPSGVLQTFRRSVERRLSGEPVAWIIGVKEFWGLEFSVGPGVLCPRPDSETLVEAALETMDGMAPASTAEEKRSASGNAHPRLRLHDCCCGPGTLALAIAKERPDWEISASDISEDAARWFAENNEKLCAGKAAYARSDLMDGVDGPFEVIVSNPPYLTPAETEERTALGWREPVLALDGGGEDGLDVIRRLIPRVFDRLIPGGALLMEADPLQMPKIGEILIDNGFEDVRTRRDMGDRERVVEARKRGGT